MIPSIFSTMLTIDSPKMATELWFILVFVALYIIGIIIDRGITRPTQLLNARLWSFQSISSGIIIVLY